MVHGTGRAGARHCTGRVGPMTYLECDVAVKVGLTVEHGSSRLHAHVSGCRVLMHGKRNLTTGGENAEAACGFRIR